MPPDIEKMEDDNDVVGLAQALKSGDDKIREAAAEALCNVGDTSSVEPLIEALRDREWVVARYAAEALGFIGDPRAVGALEKASGSRHPTDKSGVVSRVAAEALTKIKIAQTATDPLSRLLTRQWSKPSSSATVMALVGTVAGYCTHAVWEGREQTKCLEAIAKLSEEKEPVVAEALCYAALDSNSWQVRKAAAQVLRTMENPGVTHVLCQALHYDGKVNPLVGSDWTLPHHALWALRVIADQSARGAIASFLDGFRWAGRPQGGIRVMSGADAMAWGMQRDNEVSICLAACWALAVLGGGEAITAVEAVLSDEYWARDEKVRKELAGLIAQMKDKKQIQ